MNKNHYKLADSGLASLIAILQFYKGYLIQYDLP